MSNLIPFYQVIEQIRKEEKKIAREKVRSANDKIKVERERKEKLEFTMITTLFDKNVSVKNIAKIMEITPKAVESIINKINLLVSKNAK
jgi:hypothetical protein